MTNHHAQLQLLTFNFEVVGIGLVLTLDLNMISVNFAPSVAVRLHGKTAFRFVCSQNLIFLVNISINGALGIQGWLVQSWESLN
jgi:hypothetical protein